ncbi:hypothetical protein ACLOJK_004971 [Asimina triloba]
MEESASLITAPLIEKKGKDDGGGEGPSTSGISLSEAGALADGNSPIEQVALTVPITDDASIPVLTFRMWVLGTLSCVLLSFLNQFFWYRTEPLSITSISAQIAVVPLGHLMAATITERVFLKGSRWEFTLNPGPFNTKEHVLITIFANSGAGTVYAIHIVTAVKIFYKRTMTFFVAFLVVLTTQVLGFGWAGIFRRYLVDPAEMWWPINLVQVSLFREPMNDGMRWSTSRLNQLGSLAGGMEGTTVDENGLGRHLTNPPQLVIGAVGQAANVADCDFRSVALKKHVSSSKRIWEMLSSICLLECK